MTRRARVERVGEDEGAHRARTRSDDGHQLGRVGIERQRQK